MSKLRDLYLFSDLQLEPTEQFYGYSPDVLDDLLKEVGTLRASTGRMDYQGTAFWVWEMQDGRWIVVSTSYGSCSGCCAWEASSTPADGHELIQEAIDSAEVFESRDALMTWLKGESIPLDDNYRWNTSEMQELTEQLTKGGAA